MQDITKNNKKIRDFYEKVKNNTYFYILNPTNVKISAYTFQGEVEYNSEILKGKYVVLINRSLNEAEMFSRETLERYIVNGWVFFERSEAQLAEIKEYKERLNYLKERYKSEFDVIPKPLTMYIRVEHELESNGDEYMISTGKVLIYGYKIIDIELIKVMYLVAEEDNPTLNAVEDWMNDRDMDFGSFEFKILGYE